LSILLDTNACISVMNGRPLIVRERFKRQFRFGDLMMLSTISLFELWFGVVKGTHTAINTEQLTNFLRSIELLPFDDDDARSAASLKAKLARAGQPMGPYDLLIAGQGLRRDIVVVSSDVRAFSRIPGLRWENWAE
jgi:tRNA(fMet)-specific endonuclease VapC